MTDKAAVWQLLLKKGSADSQNLERPQYSQVRHRLLGRILPSEQALEAQVLVQCRECVGQIALQVEGEVSIAAARTMPMFCQDNERSGYDPTREDTRLQIP